MKKHVLLVDDDEKILEGLQTILSEEGYKVCTTSDCKKINEEIKNHQPQLILMDIFIGDQYGVDIAKDLKEKEDTKDIPVVMMSSSPHVRELAREAQANAYLSKPIEMGRFLRVVEHFQHA